MSDKHTMICRHCGENLDGGDIYEVLRENHPTATDEQILRMAKSYGWTRETPIRFSHEVVVQPDSRSEPEYTECPVCRGVNPCAPKH
jgi:hypothetical protein